MNSVVPITSFDEPMQVDENLVELLERFPDLWPIRSESRLSLRWPTASDYFFDPSVHSTRVFGHDSWTTEQMHRFWEVRRTRSGIPIVLSFLHSYAVIGLSQCHSKLPKSLIHFDDHTDMMAILAKRDGREGFLRNGIDGSSIDLTGTYDCLRSISCGIVNKANFVTALALAGCIRRIHHVQNHVSTRHRKIGFVSKGESVLGTSVIETTPEDNAREQSLEYTHTSEIAFNVGEYHESDHALWIDIDCDYFCNPWNGDSDLLNTPRPYRREQVMRQISAILDLIEERKENVQCITIALSPNFFPSHLWSLIENELIIQMLQH